MILLLLFPQCNDKVVRLGMKSPAAAAFAAAGAGRA
jgi:hypothetical protein